jgi:predicted membrane-bound mannosyltransferase
MRALRAALGRLGRPDAVTAAVLAVVAVALVLRLVDLGARAMHHDESLHAFFSWEFAQGRGYRHDPLMHGPFQFHMIAAAFKLFGASDFVARLPAALLGTALVATPLLLRRWLGGVGTVATAVFLAFAPGLLYFSRFARNDVFIALWTVLLIAAVWRYRDDGRLRWLLLLAAMLALGFATKEVTYILAAVLLVYLDVLTWRNLLGQRRLWRTASGGREPRWPRRWTGGAIAAALLPLAWLVVALWPFLGRLRARLGLLSRTREGDLLLVAGTLVATQLAPAVQIPLEAAGVVVGPDNVRWVGWSAGAALVLGGAFVGLSWRPRWWLACFGLFALITVPLFTALLTNPDGFVTGFWGSLDYWLEQQDVNRGEQPWFYYLMLVPIYDLWLLVPALGGAAWLLVRGFGGRRDTLAALLVWWFLGTLAALSLAGEKMPWLLVHLTTPLALLAGYVLGQALPPAVRRLARRDASSLAWAAGGAGAAAFALLAVLALRSGVLVSFAHPDTPVEPLIYTQTTREVPDLSARIREAFERTGKGERPSMVVIDTTASLTWPRARYLRELPVSYLTAEEIRERDSADRAILIVAQFTLGADHALRREYGEAVPYRHRWWFPEDGYRAASFRHLLDGLREGWLVEDWLAFLAERIDREAIGSLDGEVLFPEEGPEVATGA